MSVDLSFDDDIEDLSIKTDGDGVDTQGDVNKIDKAFKKYQKQKDNLNRFKTRVMMKKKKKTDELNAL